MADRPTDPSPARRPSDGGREDTVVRPLSGQPAPQNAPDGQSRVLPPLPEGANGSRNGAANAAPAQRPAPARRPSAPAPTVATPPAVPPAAPVSPVAAPAPQPRVAPAPQATQARATPTKPSKSPRPSRDQRRAEKVAPAPRPGRRARLRLTRVDPWSVMKTAFLLSIALAIVTVVSVLMVWTVLGAADVWSSINETVQDVVGGQEASTFDIEDYLGTRRVVGFTMIVAAVDVVLLTAISTLGAFLYNMSASLLGGIEVTLAEDN
jgi:hypothetical protein